MFMLLPGDVVCVLPVHCTRVAYMAYIVGSKHEQPHAVAVHCSNSFETIVCSLLITRTAY